MDQVAALEWVRENIQVAFGGDRDRVTVLRTSPRARDRWRALLVMPTRPPGCSPVPARRHAPAPTSLSRLADVITRSVCPSSSASSPLSFRRTGSPGGCPAAGTQSWRRMRPVRRNAGGLAAHSERSCSRRSWTVTFSPATSMGGVPDGPRSILIVFFGFFFSAHPPRAAPAQSGVVVCSARSPRSTPRGSRRSSRRNPERYQRRIFPDPVDRSEACARTGSYRNAVSGTFAEAQRAGGAGRTSNEPDPGPAPGLGGATRRLPRAWTSRWCSGNLTVGQPAVLFGEPHACSAGCPSRMQARLEGVSPRTATRVGPPNRQRL
jgi:hypothetical protein